MGHISGEFLISPTIKTAIKPALLKWKLFIGTLLAITGASVIVLSGSFLSVEALKKWGLFLLLFSLSLIALGLIPYRRLQKLEIKPNELELLDHGLAYRKNGKVEWILPYSSITDLDYVEDPWRYGIRLKVEERWALFLPYFTRRSFESLKRDLDTISG